MFCISVCEEIKQRFSTPMIDFKGRTSPCLELISAKQDSTDNSTLKKLEHTKKLDKNNLKIVRNFQQKVQFVPISDKCGDSPLNPCALKTPIIQKSSKKVCIIKEETVSGRPYNDMHSMMQKQEQSLASRRDLLLPNAKKIVLIPSPSSKKKLFVDPLWNRLNKLLL